MATARFQLIICTQKNEEEPKDESTFFYANGIKAANREAARIVAAVPDQEFLGATLEFYGGARGGEFITQWTSMPGPDR